MIFKTDVITSRNNPLVKWASCLSLKKGRDEFECFIAEGEKLSFEALGAGLPVSHIFVCEDKKDSILNKLSLYSDMDLFEKTEIITVSHSVFEKISTEKAPQGIISVIKYLDFFRYVDIIYKEDFFFSPDESIILLSSVRDPSNLGSVIRSAVAFGVSRVIISSDSADVYNPKTVRSAMGSLFRVKVDIAKDVKEVISCLINSGRRVFAAELRDRALALSDISLTSSDVFVIGNEGHGISDDISSVCTGSVYIPISKNTESLNASVAAAIFMWEQNKRQ